MWNKKCQQIVFKVLLFLLLLCVPCSSLQAIDGDGGVESIYISMRMMDQFPQIYEFLVNEKVVLRIRSMANGLSAQERAAIITERAKQLGHEFQPDNISVSEINGTPTIMMKGVLFLTVTEEDRLANNSTGAGLRDLWAKNLINSLQSHVQINPPEVNKEEEQALSEKELKDVVESTKIWATSEEIEMLELVNKERVAAGVEELQLDPELIRIARIKAQDMIEKEYFDHVSPTYGDPFTMLTSFGITYSYAGENLAGNQSVKNAHQALMESPGHRRNILNPNYTHIGIAVLDGGPYGKMFTQLFVK